MPATKPTSGSICINWCNCVNLVRSQRTEVLMKTRIVVRGPSDLIPKALQEMFERTDDDGFNLIGICIGRMCLAVPKDKIVSIPCSIYIQCTGTSERLGVLGYGSRSFLNATMDRQARITLAGRRMSHRKKKGYHEYVIEIEA